MDAYSQIAKGKREHGMSRYIDATEITEQIANFKKAVNSPHSDYMTGYLSALSVTEGMIANTPTADVAPIADTVRKMHSEIKKRCIKGGIYPAFVASTIDQIQKEMLEGEEEAAEPQ